MWCWVFSQLDSARFTTWNGVETADLLRRRWRRASRSGRGRSSDSSAPRDGPWGYLGRCRFARKATCWRCSGAADRIGIWSLAAGRLVAHRQRPQAQMLWPSAGTRAVLAGAQRERHAVGLACGWYSPSTRSLPVMAEVLPGVAFSPDGRAIASVSKDRSLRVWDAASGELKFLSPPFDAEVQSVAFSPDGRWIATGDWTPAVRLWDAATFQSIARWDVANTVSHVWRVPVRSAGPLRGGGWVRRTCCLVLAVPIHGAGPGRDRQR